MSRLLFKEAESSTELEQVHALNHRVFADEIGQHTINSSGLLIDRFHAQNRYFIAVRDGVVVGMISANAGPEFSIAKRLTNLRVLHDLPRPLEIRLLAIDPQQRNRMILAGLVWQVYSFSLSNGFSHLLISAITERESMYRKLGFRSLGPPVPDGAASFTPMMRPVVEQNRSHSRHVTLYERHCERMSSKSEPVSLMPGPVCISPGVTAAFASVPVSHRSSMFRNCYGRVTSVLNGLLTGAEAVVFPGGGTLANDAVAANLKAIFKDRRGLVISNGEFGERLINQAEMAGLLFDRVSTAWGRPWPFAAIANRLDQKPAWIWAVQLETSTGVLNDTESLIAMANDAGCALALDCVSSVGATRIASEAGPVFFATGVSGKSLGSYAGLAFVYLSEECRFLLSRKMLCPSFDLLRMHEVCGPVSTIPSSSVFALARSLEDHYGSPESVARRFEHYSALGQQTRRQMRSLGLAPISPEAVAAPNITSFALPDDSFPKQCLEAGFQIAFESQYLQSRNWGQIATMGNITSALLDEFFEALERRGVLPGSLSLARKS